MRNIILFISILTLSGCATTSDSGMNNIMSSWVGSSIDKAVAQWGYPHEQRQVDERVFYLWHHIKSGFIPTAAEGRVNAYGEFNATYTSGNIHEIEGSCDRILEVNDQGIVTRWEWRGNKCPFIEAREYLQWANQSRLN